MAKELKAIHSDYNIIIEESGTVNVQLNGKVCSNAVKALRTIANDVNFPYSDEWNTRHFGKKLVEFLNSTKPQSKPNVVHSNRQTP